MQITETRRSRLLTPAFSQKIRRVVLLLSLLAVAVFGLFTERLLHDQAERSSIELARLCAAALTPGVNGDLSESVNRLRSRYPRLLAIATLNVAGNVETVYPERIAHRRAVNAVLAGGHPVLPSGTGRWIGEQSVMVVRAPDDGEPIPVVGIALALNGSSMSSARQVLVVLQSRRYGSYWLRATALFGLLMISAALLSVQSMKRWFDHRIAAPLRGLADVFRHPERHGRPVAGLRVGEWRETSEIAALLHELLQDANESEARVRQVERETQHRILARQRGFDRALRRARDQATHDALSRLRNRAFLEAKLEPLFRQQQNELADLSVVMIDVDNFKQYNDSKGHLAGDELLRFVGSLLRGAVRPTDHAIRYGGDEFLLLLPETSVEEATAVTRRLVKLFSQYANRLTADVSLSMSAGVSSLRTDQPQSGHDLVAKADAALYEAKRTGKNTVVTHNRAA